MRRLSKQTYAKAYNTYIKKVKEWEIKGYKVVYLSKAEFRNAYDEERRKASKSSVTARKSNIIRRMASESRELTSKEYKSLKKRVKEYNKQVEEWNKFADEYFEATGDEVSYEEYLSIGDISSLSRQGVWDLGMSLYGDEEDARDFYNTIE